MPDDPEQALPEAERGRIRMRPAAAWRSIRETGEALVALLGAGWSVRQRLPGHGLDRFGSDPAGHRRPEAAGDASRGGDGDRRSEVTAGPARSAPVDEARRLAARVDRASRLLPWEPSCLVRALALKRLLFRRGLPSVRLRVGVRRPDGALVAHAWVELEDVIVSNAPEDVEGYVPMSELEVFRE